MTEQKPNIQLSPEAAQQFKIMQARIANADLAEMDMRKEINTLLQMLLTQITALQKENAELKAKQQAKQEDKAKA
jgi:hypothetical protein